MKTVGWIVTGLALAGIATLLSQSGPAGETALGMPLYLPLVIIGLASQYCFWRALRSAIGDVWSVLTGRGGKPAEPSPPRGSAITEDAAPSSDFDADAAFARYMEQRAAQGTQTQSAPSIVPQPSAVRPHAQGGFGRKVI